MTKNEVRNEYLRASGGRDLFAADPQETDETISAAVWLVLALSLALMIAAAVGFFAAA